MNKKRNFWWDLLLNVDVQSQFGVHVKMLRTDNCRGLPCSITKTLDSSDFLSSPSIATDQCSIIFIFVVNPNFDIDTISVQYLLYITVSTKTQPTFFHEMYFHCFWISCYTWWDIHWRILCFENFIAQNETLKKH